MTWWAQGLARRTLRPYATKFSQKGFVLAQLFASLVLSEMFGLGFNELARHDPGVWFDKLTYRDRHAMEQCVCWLKENRRICTRFEKLAVNFHEMLQLAMIKRPGDWVEHVNEPLSDRELDRLRVSIEQDRPFGSDGWVAKTVMGLGLEHTVRREGRPRKVPA